MWPGPDFCGKNLIPQRNVSGGEKTIPKGRKQHLNSLNLYRFFRGTTETSIRSFPQRWKKKHQEKSQKQSMIWRNCDASHWTRTKKRPRNLKWATQHLLSYRDYFNNKAYKMDTCFNLLPKLYFLGESVSQEKMAPAFSPSNQGFIRWTVKRTLVVWGHLGQGWNPNNKN